MSALREDEHVRWHLHGLNTGAIFGLARWGVDHLPRPVSDLVGRTGTWLAFRLATQTTAALIANQRVVAPGLSERERRALALRTYRTYVSEVTDLFRSLSMGRHELSSLESPLTALDHLKAGKGALLVTGHLGNLELGAVLLRARHDLRLTVVVLPEPDPAVNAQRRRMRAAVGIDTLEVRDAADTALSIRQRLADNQVVVLVCDRALGRDRIDVEFFGRRTGFLRSPALLAYLTGAPLVPAFILRQPDGRYVGYAAEPLHMPRTGKLHDNVRGIMQAFASVLESQVAGYPHLWYQFYPYWSDGDGHGRDGANPTGE
jgi:KDO2-lipid IV(A) lauroyltransferase